VLGLAAEIDLHQSFPRLIDPPADWSVGSRIYLEISPGKVESIEQLQLSPEAGIE